MSSSSADGAAISEHRVYCIDDIVTFNTQTSTQWDGFRHFAYKHWPEKDVYTYHGGMTEAEALDVTNHKYGTQSKSSSCL